VSQGDSQRANLGRLCEALGLPYREIPNPAGSAPWEQDEAARWLAWERDADQPGSLAAIARGMTEHANALLELRAAVCDYFAATALVDQVEARRRMRALAGVPDPRPKRTSE
jgi:hypothetical protein